MDTKAGSGEGGTELELSRDNSFNRSGSRHRYLGPTLMVEETGVRKVGNEEYYTIQFYGRLDETKKGEIACTTAEESKNGLRHLTMPRTSIDLEGHRPRVRRYASGLKKLIRIGQGGPETLSRQGSSLGNSGSFGDFEGEFGDAVEAHEWKCVRTINGVRILEDVSDSKSGKASLVKAVAIVDASVDTVLEVILNTDRQRRYEWDMLTGDLELVDSYDGNYDVVYGTYDPKYLIDGNPRKILSSRQWFQGQDGAYTILQFPAVHKKRPPRNGYQRTTIKLNDLETYSIMLSQHIRSGLKEYIGANPSLKCESSSIDGQSKHPDGELPDEFYDAISGAESSTTEDEESDDEPEKEEKPIKEKPASSTLSSSSLKQTSAVKYTKYYVSADANKELDPSVPPIHVDASQFNGSLHQGKDDDDTNCWTSPGGAGFMIRGKTYLKNSAKITGGRPFSSSSCDWFKVDKATDKIALHPKSQVQVL
ncbi:leucine-rich repeat receptor-like protein kinase TDR-like [Hibiscus syriacus]|uniref:Leucine-rich repeat receptor-like protein kinase TDR-like n=1 Tax=Hibiscus syriacus TaxID=106335 RepID=A0A6A3C178_HIBSY|nr:leucine-rich repeat receptor-like protein kinase TDR-like [Hibiscus syriacus]